MSIERVQTSRRMSKAVIHNQTVYLCGQVAEDRKQGIEQQTSTMLAKVDELLASVGSDKSKLLTATIYLKSMQDFDAMNRIWEDWLPKGCAPARACVAAHMASEELLVEISVVAAL